jgi:tRNA(adenine34) deaminase
MENKYRQLIKNQYVNSSRDDSTQLFKTILSVAEETGLEDALEYLEECVIEKRAAWLERNEKNIEKTGNPLADGYKLFYECYLGITIPVDGEIIEANDRRIVMRWWNKCSTLEACQALGLDTREICKKVHHRPVQLLLSRIDARLKFKRNYGALRPYTPYCEESIELEEPGFSNE